MLSLEEFSHDSAILPALMSYWNRCFNFFRLPCGPMSVTLMDVAAIAGLLVDGFEVSSVMESTREEESIDYNITPKCTGFIPFISQSAGLGVSDKPDEEEATTVLLWGNLFLRTLYRSLYSITTPSDTAPFGTPCGHMWILQIWAWMYFPDPDISPSPLASSKSLLSYGALYASHPMLGFIQWVPVPPATSRNRCCHQHLTTFKRKDLEDGHEEMFNAREDAVFKMPPLLPNCSPFGWYKFLYTISTMPIGD
ncbi:hypothetical protein CCACVL1_06122 [Corchorus capsularis]|uniref:Aminotransferase-like plant mobile domain-containing protein n=1 Tax=Corchorus capsularis TaxID=210143 RepID=A0A1R3JH99_COCAP|nr:hypothetical protein CCACVL1_06122 [Corchorus capsularis]